jgi:excisionase family DNA binding protein
MLHLLVTRGQQLCDRGREREAVMEEQTQLIDVGEAAEMLRLKESTIRSWILKKKIPYVKLGRRVFVRRSDAQKAIDSNVIYPTTEQRAA